MTWISGGVAFVVAGLALLSKFGIVVAGTPE